MGWECASLAGGERTWWLHIHLRIEGTLGELSSHTSIPRVSMKLVSSWTLHVHSCSGGADVECKFSTNFPSGSLPVVFAQKCRWTTAREGNRHHNLFIASCGGGAWRGYILRKLGTPDPKWHGYAFLQRGIYIFHNSSRNRTYWKRAEKLAMNSRVHR